MPLVLLWCYFRHGSTWVDDVCATLDHSPLLPMLCFWAQKVGRSLLDEVTEVLDRKMSTGHIKNNSSTKETKYPLVINVSTLLFILFVRYSSFNFTILVLVTWHRGIQKLSQGHDFRRSSHAGGTQAAAGKWTPLVI